MPKKSTAKAKIKVTAAAPADATPAINTGGGIRSAPTQNTWRSWRQDNAAQSKDRVMASRYLQEVIPFLGYLVEQLPEEAIGDGLVPTSESKNAEFKKAATAYFDQWARSPAIDIRRRFDFYTSQHMLARTMIGDGEVFVLKVADRRPEAMARPLTDKSFRALQLQFLTRDQVGNGTAQDFSANGSGLVWDQGIQFNSLEIPQAYRVLKQINKFLVLNAYDQKPADQVLHIFADRMFNQRHGTPWLFRGEKSMLDALDLKAVKKYAAKIRAYFLGAITTPTGDTPASMRTNVRRGTKPDAENPAQKVDTGMRFLELAGGISLPVLKDGETISFFHGQEPISFAELLKEIWDEAVYCFGYPPEYLLNLVGLGSAAVRMVLRKVRKGHDRIRRPVREQYCQAVWEFVIGDAIERKQLQLVDDWRMVTWKGGVDPSIDAGRDERAEQEKLRTFTGTVEQYCDALGLDGETVRHNRLDEIADNILYGAERGLPWFMCIDAFQVQAMTGLATSLGVDIQDLVKQISTTKNES
jgi:capsid protein